MEAIIKTTLIGLFFGTFGTTLGGIIGVKLNKTSNKFLSFILSFASGLMTAIICFELIPEALEIASLPIVILGIIVGIVMMIICDILVDKKFNNRGKDVDNLIIVNKAKNKEIINKKIINNKIENKKLKKEDKFLQEKNKLLKTGIIVSIGLAIHNFPEGLAIGSGFEASLKLGLSLAIAICFHDIPERHINVSSYEKWWNETIKSNLLCCFIWNYYWNRSFFWKHSWRNFARNNCFMFSLFSRRNDIYSIRRAYSGIK